MDLYEIIRLVPTFIVGCFIGSFLNVCIHRLPRNESVSYPGSRCYVCGTKVLWYDNIPVLSWLFLRGRCRHCGSPFSIRYLFGEVLVGLLTLGACAWVFLTDDLAPMWSAAGGWDLLASQAGEVAVRFLFAASLLVFIYYIWVSAVIDIDHQIIPDELTKPMQMFAPVLAVSVPVSTAISSWPMDWFLTLEPMNKVPLWRPWHGVGITAVIVVAVLVFLLASVPLARQIYSKAVQRGERWSEEDHVGFRKGVHFFVVVTAVQLLILCGLAAFAKGGSAVDPMKTFDPADPGGALLPNGMAWLTVDFARALLGSLTGWLSLYLIGFVGTLAFRRNAMGYGDVKFLAPLGALLGPLGVVYCFFFAALIGTFVGVPLRLLKKSQEIPFGPYLALGALIALLAGPSLSAVLFG